VIPRGDGVQFTITATRHCAAVIDEMWGMFGHDAACGPTPVLTSELTLWPSSLRGYLLLQTKISLPAPLNRRNAVYPDIATHLQTLTKGPSIYRASPVFVLLIMSRRPPNPAAERAAKNQQTIKSLLKLEANKVCADCKRNKRGLFLAPQRSFELAHN
jgi:hypothetical protein